MSESIEDVFFKYLSADTVLSGLLGASGSDPKIYPIIAQEGASAPHIVYIRMGEGSLDEILDNLRIAIKITVGSYGFDTASSIRDRVKALLDLQSNTMPIQAFSTDYYIDWCKQNGGMDEVDNETKEVIKILNFDVIFRKNS